jgi:membrane protease YdiL (CAAX protease family)
LPLQLRERPRTWFHRRVTWDIWLIFFVLGVVVPWRGRIRLRHLLTVPHVGTRERIALYLSTILFQWIAVAVVGWRAWAHGFSWAELGLATPSYAVVVGGILGASALAGLQRLNLRRMGQAGARVQNLRTLGEKILPRTRVELMAFLALAVTAGICEEFLYRGFAVAVFSRAGYPAWLVVFVTAVLFGLAHLYQGRGGLFGTMILGVLFGALRIACASLVPVILSHAAIDVMAGIAGPRYLLQRSSNDVVDVSAIISIT